MEQTNTNNYKRQDRKVSDETKQKISDTLKAYNASHPRTQEHSQKISDGLINYWQQIPEKDDTPNVENGDIV